jgi:hypothetical protein
MQGPFLPTSRPAYFFIASMSTGERWICGYVDGAELGVSGLIKEDSQEKYVQCGDDDKTGRKRLYFEEPAIFERVNKNIISDGFTCYCARRQDLADMSMLSR